VAFFGACAVLGGLLLCDDVGKNLHLFARGSVEFSTLLRYHALSFVASLPLVIPVALFLSSAFSFGRLHRRNEILAMRCCGLSIIQIIKAPLVCSIALACLNLVLEASAVPMAIGRITAMRLEMSSKVGRPTVAHAVGFYNHRDGRVWLFGELDRLSHVGADVTVNCRSKDGTEALRIFAVGAKFSRDVGHWIFTDGSAMKFDPITGLSTGVEMFAERAFPAFTEPPAAMLTATKKTKNLSFSEVVAAMDYAAESGSARACAVKFHGTFANAVGCLILTLLTIPFAVAGVRVNPMVNVAAASAVLLLFMAVGAVCTTLGNHGILPPMVAAWAANVAMLFPLIGMFRRAL
jgi:lipopolysaccharide export system permease protein